MLENQNRSSVIVGITGASGAMYALRLMECLLLADKHIYVIVSKAGMILLSQETDLKLSGNKRDMEQYLVSYFKVDEEQISLLSMDDWMSPVASGSIIGTPMVVVPCTVGCLSAIACGASDNLLERAADVAIKEGNKLILAVRETPLSSIHLENMLKLSRLGVVMMTTNPGFYHQPETINDLIDFMVAKILDHLEVEQTLLPKWGVKPTNNIG